VADGEELAQARAAERCSESGEAVQEIYSIVDVGSGSYGYEGAQEPLKSPATFLMIFLFVATVMILFFCLV
jgi:hypothetical protein